MINKLRERPTLLIIGAIIGAFAGFWYYHEIGCSSGTCLITSRPVNSSIYGAAVGLLLFSVLEKGTKDPPLKKD